MQSSVLRCCVAATCVSFEISVLPTSQTIRPSSNDWTSTVDVLPFYVALSSDVALPIVSSNSSPAMIASSSSVVNSLSSVCAYIEMPIKAVDTTTTVDESDSNADFIFRSLNNPIQRVCH